MGCKDIRTLISESHIWYPKPIFDLKSNIASGATEALRAPLKTLVAQMMISLEGLFGEAPRRSVWEPTVLQELKFLTHPCQDGPHHPCWKRSSASLAVEEAFHIRR